MTELSLCDNYISYEGAQSIAVALKVRSVMIFVSSRLAIGGNCNFFWCILQNPNCKVTNLNIRGTGIGAKGVKSIAEALQVRFMSCCEYVDYQYRLGYITRVCMCLRCCRMPSAK